MEQSSTRRIVYLGLLTGLALGLHLFENMLPLPTHIALPGFKLGLANIVSLYVILNFSIKDAVIIAILRTVLGSLAGGTFLSITFFFSFFGGVVSTLVMGLAERHLGKYFSLLGISLIGAVVHNLTQLSIAAVIIESAGIFGYLPYMLFFALPTGAFVGLVTGQINRYYSISKY